MATVAEPHVREALWAYLRHLRENPRAFAYDCFADPSSPSGRLELAPHQADVMARSLAGRDVTWRAGHGVGKTTTLAILTFAHLLVFRGSKVITTAPTWQQVRNILWSEIAKWYARFRYRDLFILQRTKLEVVAAPREWFAIGVASNRQENIEGFHADHLLYLVDEAKGVPDPIFDSIDGALSGAGGRRLYASTPGSRVGKFYQSHHGRIATLFDIVHTDGETVPRVSRRWIELKRQEWGETSPVYVAKVRGEFPQEGDDVLYPLDWIDEAVRAFAEIDPATGRPAVAHASRYAFGCDVARFGANRTVLVGGSRRRLDRLWAWAQAPTTETTARILGEWRALMTAGQPVHLMAIDDGGLGGGVTDQLRQAMQHERDDQRVTIEGVQLGGAPSDEGREYFANKKAEMAWRLRQALDENRQARARGEPGTFAVLPDERLQGQLAAMRRRYTARGALQVVDPDDPGISALELPPGTKVSPDHAHAAILAYDGASAATSVAVGAVLHPHPSPRPSARRWSHYVLGRGPGHR